MVHSISQLIRGGDANSRAALRSWGTAMSQSAKAHEPSMDEILASIRRIIADYDTPKPEPVAPPPRPAATPLRAVSPVPAAPPAPPSPRPALKSSAEHDEINAVLSALDSPAVDEPAAHSEDALEWDGSMAVPPQSATVRTRRPNEPGVERGLLSSEASAAVDTAFTTLAHTVLLQNARTLEDMVREMLRPMLKSWLDDNLPSMVERIVRAEIERVSRGRG
jgi:cell pole-organizing protein PopZ